MGVKMVKRREIFKREMERRETLLQTMQVLLRMKLITRRADLAATAIYYRACNVLCKALF
jgi:hypothetical protein